VAGRGRGSREGTRAQGRTRKHRGQIVFPKLPRKIRIVKRPCSGKQKRKVEKRGKREVKRKTNNLGIKIGRVPRLKRGGTEKGGLK